MLDQSLEDVLEQLRRAFPPGPFLDRRLGRAFAFQALYEMDLAHHAPESVLDRLASGMKEPGQTAYPAEILAGATEYATALVRGVLACRPKIDALIHERAPLWPLAQMSAVDRNALRIGLYESLFGNATVPLRTAINEAVELAKLFGSETSAKFVNGVLGRAVEAGVDGSPEPRSSGAAGRPQPPDPACPPDNNHTQPPTSAGSGERGLDDGHER